MVSLWEIDLQRIHIYVRLMYIKLGWMGVRRRMCSMIPEGTRMMAFPSIPSNVHGVSDDVSARPFCSIQNSWIYGWWMWITTPYIYIHTNYIYIYTYIYIYILYIYIYTYYIYIKSEPPFWLFRFTAKWSKKYETDGPFGLKNQVPPGTILSLYSRASRTYLKVFGYPPRGWPDPNTLGPQGPWITFCDF